MSLLDPASPSGGEALATTQACKGAGCVLVALLCSQLKLTDLLFYRCRVQRVVRAWCSGRSDFWKQSDALLHPSAPSQLGFLLKPGYTLKYPPRCILKNPVSYRPLGVCLPCAPSLTDFTGKNTAF